MSNKRRLGFLLVVAFMVVALVVPAAALAAQPRAVGTGATCFGVPFDAGNPNHHLVPDQTGTFVDKDVNPFAGPGNFAPFPVATLDLRSATAPQYIYVNFNALNGGNALYPTWAGFYEIWGSPYGDYFCGGEGAGWFYGLEGDDMIALEGTDTGPVIGGAVFYYDVVYAGSGDDTVYGWWAPGDPIGVGPLTDESGVNAWLGMGDDWFMGASSGDIARGGMGDDWIAGFTGADRIFGNLGNDTILGNQPRTLGDGLAADAASNAGLFGGPGDDLVTGGEAGEGIPGGFCDNSPLHFTGAVGVFLGPGDDIFNGTNKLIAAGSDVVNGGSGNDELNGEFGVDWLFGGPDDDAVNGDDSTPTTAGDGPNCLDGNKGDDVLMASTGAGRANGHAGHDIVLGNVGADTLSGGRHGDYLVGGNGSDWINGNNGRDFIFGGADTPPYGDNAPNSLFGDKGDDEVHGGSGADPFVFGDDQANTFTGDDFVYGHAGDDFMDGGNGTDYVSGGDGKDTVQGGDGADTLLGGAGDDLLNGFVVPGTDADGDIDDMYGGLGDDSFWGACADLDIGNENLLEGFDKDYNIPNWFGEPPEFVGGAC